MNSGFEVSQITQTLNELITKQSINREVIDALRIDDLMVPKEGWIWDFKEEFPSDTYGLAKNILHIVSFHNTCGGYLVYGVKEEEKDRVFRPVVTSFAHVNQAQIRDKIENYTGEHIDLSMGEVKVKFADAEFDFFVICVPKRREGKSPVQFTKRGPENKKGKTLFEADDVYLRRLDECARASCTSDWQILLSPRILDPATGVYGEIEQPRRSDFYDNLPDRQLICSRFIGRDNVLSKLWEWLSDEYEHVKILAGDGGKGKTSIAYEFCKSVKESPPSEFERILWLSAKEKQFSALEDDFITLQIPHFEDTASFMAELADSCALDNSEYPEMSPKAIKKDLMTGLQLFPSLIVVDDVDSLTDEEQRTIVETCRHLGTKTTRFLITTRRKFSYSTDLCIEVPGLDLEEFSGLVNSLTVQYSLKTIKSGDLTKLHQACDGSPLLATSILRLYKQGMQLNSAINEWKGQAGEDARNAALLREIESLTPDAKKVLLAIYYFRSCAFSELKQATGFAETLLGDCIEQLSSLFLVEEPQIIESERRYSLSTTTALTVAKNAKDLSPSYKALERSVKETRKGVSSKKTGNRHFVGLAISQANSLLKERKIVEAIETVNNELNRFSGNPDLLLMKARCLMSQENSDYNSARELLNEAIKGGQSKELALELLFECENHLKMPNGMIECAESAIQGFGQHGDRWHERLAQGLLLRSNSREGEEKVRDLSAASHALSATLQFLNTSEKVRRVSELRSLNDITWQRLENDESISWLSSFDFVMGLIRDGDARTAMYERAVRCIDEAKAEPARSKGKQDAIDICAIKIAEQINNRNDHDKEDRPFSDLLERLSVDK